MYTDDNIELMARSYRATPRALKVTHPPNWGLIIGMIHPNMDLPFWQQIDLNYAHGGGWHDMSGFTPDLSGDVIKMTFEGDPPYVEIARIEDTETGEMLVLFPYSFVLWVGADGSTKVARID